MRAKTLFSAFVITTGLAVGGVVAAPTMAQNTTPAPAAGAPRNWLTIPQIHERLEAAGYHDVEEIKRERDGYEVKATDRNGQRVELEVDPRTGDVTKTVVKRNKHKDERSADRRGDGRAAAPAPFDRGGRQGAGPSAARAAILKIC